MKQIGNQIHIPVMLESILKVFSEVHSDSSLNLLDCTMGQAGHSVELYNRLKKGVLFSIDLNYTSIEWVSNKYGHDLSTLKLSHDNNKVWQLIQSDFAKYLSASDLKFDFILANLGFSNYELQKIGGLAYSIANSPLDMRYDSASSLTAAIILRTYSESQLIAILERYGELKEASKVAEYIIKYRASQSIKTTGQLINILKKFGSYSIPKVFQALRIEVNQEFTALQSLIKYAPSKLKKSGYLCVITFNQIESRLIEESGLEFKIVEPDITEIISNTQSRSAKLYIYKNE